MVSVVVRSDAIVQVTDLIGRPGVSRQVDLLLPTPDLDQPLAEPEESVRLQSVIESVVDGLLVRGTVTLRIRLSCARCLQPVDDETVAAVTELFTEVAAAPADELPDPGYEIVEGRIDLDTMLRDALAPAMPYRPLCTPDCQGLCAMCGADLNTTTCACADEDVDPRWAPLQALRVSAHPSGGPEDRDQDPA